MGATFPSIRTVGACACLAASALAWVFWRDATRPVERARAIAARSATSEGPTLVEAEVLSGELVATPGGALGVGFVSLKVDPHGYRRDARAELALNLRVNGADTILTLVNPVIASAQSHVPVWWVGEGAVPRMPALLVIPTRTLGTPAREIVLTPGDRVELALCRRGNVLQTCREGDDFLSLRGTGSIASRLREDGQDNLAVSAAIALAAALMALAGSFFPRRDALLTRAARRA
jgi:hypothetical protein